MFTQIFAASTTIKTPSDAEISTLAIRGGLEVSMKTSCERTRAKSMATIKSLSSSHCLAVLQPSLFHLIQTCEKSGIPAELQLRHYNF